MDIKKFLETVDKFDFAGEKQGQKPGQQWRGTDKGLPGTKLVGELEKHVRETAVERKLKKDFDDFTSDDWADWDDKIKRLKQRAKQGELVTVWDPEKRVYKNVPKSEIKEYQNRMDPDAQVTSPPSPDASQTAIDQIKDKIFARDVEGETVEEQDATTNPYTGTDAKKFGQMSKSDQQWYTQGNKKPDINDPYIAMRAPNQGKAVQTPAVAPAAAPAPTVKPQPAPVATAPSPQAQTRPVVVDEPKKTALDPNAFKTVPQQTIKVDAPATATPAPAVQQPAKPARTTWQSLAKLNPQIKDPNKIYPGQEITLPNGTKAVVDRGDTLSGIAQRYRQGGYADGTPVQDKTTGTAGRSTGPGGPLVDPKATATVTTTPKVSGKAAAQLQKGREYRAAQAAQQGNTNLGGNAADPESQAFVNPDKPQTQTAKAEPGVTATADVGVGTGGIAAAFGDLKKRDDGNWYYPGGVKVTRPSVIAAAEKAAVKTATAPTATASGTVKQAEPKAAAISPTTTKAPLSVRNNNPGNLRFAGQPGAVKDANGYARFETPEAGRAAMRRQLNLDMQRRGMNLTQALNKYAPPSDNNPTDKYIDFVAKRVGIDPTKPIPRNKMAAIQKAMVEFEGGKRAVDAFYPTRLAAKGGTTVESLMTDYQKFVTEYGNQQNPDAQATSQDSAESDAEAELKRQRMDRRVSQATLAGLSSVLPPGTNTAVAATALNKIVDQKPLSPQENQVIGTLMPLLARAAEEPSTSASLKTALGRAGMLTKLGKQ